MNKIHRYKGLIECCVVFLILGGALLFYIVQNKHPNGIVFISKSTNVNYTFWQTMKMGAELAAKEQQIPFACIGPLEEKDTEEQIRLMQQMLDSEIEIILLAACDSEALSPLVEEAQQKNKTILTVDSTTDIQVPLIATDNHQAAQALTAYLAELINYQGQVAMINFIHGTSTSLARESGYEDEIIKYKRIEKLPTVYTEGTTESAYKNTLALLERYPDIQGIVGGNQYTLEGVTLAVDELGLNDQVKIVGFDSSSLIVSGLEKGIINAIIVQKPFNMGYLAVQQALEVFKGKTISNYTDTGYKLITPNSLYETENQKLIYPIID